MKDRSKKIGKKTKRISKTQCPIVQKPHGEGDFSVKFEQDVK